MIKLSGKDILSVADLTKQEIEAILAKAEELKLLLSRGATLPRILNGKVVGLLFEKPSTRTRVSFEAAMAQLGGTALYLRPEELQLSRGEPIKDTARVLSAYLDALLVRTYEHKALEELAAYAKIPVINALSDMEHPTQILCDMLTIKEVKGRLEGLRFAWIGDGNNTCNSWILGGSIFSMDIVVACPEGYEPAKEVIKKAEEIGRASGSTLTIVRDPFEAAKDADVIYTDVWVSMGQEAEAKKREEAFRGFQVNSRLVGHAREGVVVMHCLPAHRGQEITDEVIEGPKSVVWRQAENKLHGARGILASIIG